MTKEFIAILKKLIADRGFGVLDNAKLCHDILMNYGRNEHIPEINLFTKVLEKNFYKKLRNSSNRDLDKKQLAKYWHEEDFVDIVAAEKMLNCLCYVLFNEPLENTVSKTTFTDPRDGRVYRTVKIGDQVWMAENLNYNVPGSKCYDNNPKVAEKYGRLYDWNTAMKVCPPGWHLPSNEEWDRLYRFADDSSGTESPYDSPTAGKYLKAKSGWENCEGKSGNGNDNFGFSALPGGFGNSDGYFYNVGNFGYWWNASEGSSYNAYYRYMDHNYEGAYWYDYGKDYLYSIRCLQD
ncbi:MAG: fibrobacter succinogenes major paralogous domain-containing protein [Fibromonadaceae bacterium]|jgi:uncharacterized protein (TIGR02145 family)|nr:fibrobacter succinogenes major paralogous domain-containing protein [Fibromonadaceae bacterium]